MFKKFTSRCVTHQWIIYETETKSYNNKKFTSRCVTHQWIIYETETKSYNNVDHFCLARKKKKKKKKEKINQTNEISFCNLLIKIVLKKIISMEMKSMVSLADENAIVKVWVEYMSIK